MRLPNIRKFFVPDPGYIMLEGDLQRADAQVVAWEADDETLKEIFRSGADIHAANALDIFGPPLTDTKRQAAKVGVHAVDYGCKAKTLASHLGVTVHEADRFISRWFGSHPKVETWQKRIEVQLMTSRAVSNIYGYKRHYFDRIEDLLPEALAWIGQSTTAITINKGMVNLDEQLPEVELLLQIHDSLLMQVPEARFNDLLPQIRSAMRITLPYSDPLVIPVTFKASTISWGDAEALEEAA